MSNWTPKQALSELMSKFRRTDSDESSRYSSGNDLSASHDEGDTEISALALMNEKSPEAWLGNFLTVIGAPPALSYTSIEQARLDRNLREHLARLVGEAAREEPERMLQPEFADELRERDWSAWWRAQDALARYAYAALSLAMLGDESRLADVVALYRQESNARIRKDAHYAMCYLLGKDWPAYAVTEADMRRVESGQVSPSSGA